MTDDFKCLICNATAVAVHDPTLCAGCFSDVSKCRAVETVRLPRCPKCQRMGQQDELRDGTMICKACDANYEPPTEHEEYHHRDPGVAAERQEEYELRRKSRHKRRRA